jgi:ubiquinone/menaquinone biosynthesis C-methylase UbiE
VTRAAKRPHYEPLRSIMKGAVAASLSPEEFYWEVNHAYHDAEAPVYEELHADMFSTLLPKWERLVSPLAKAPNRSIRWLDVGCGTGLVGSHLARLLGDRISSALLVDPNAGMVETCKTRAREWPFRTRFAVGTIDLVSGSTFELVTVNSVLHHIVELDKFCGQLAAVVSRGGYLSTCHDPTTPLLHPRIRTALQYLPAPLVTILRSVRDALIRRTDSPDFPAPPNEMGDPSRDVVGIVAEATNRTLRAKGITARPLTPDEIWAVTDFHVPGQPGNFGNGVSLAALRACLRPLRLDDYFTYTTFGHGVQFGSRWCNP